MKITIDLSKLFKWIFLIVLSVAVSCSLVFVMLTGIRIVSSSPSCLGEVCFSDSLDDPLLGWTALLFPVVFIIANTGLWYIHRD